MKNLLAAALLLVALAGCTAPEETATTTPESTTNAASDNPVSDTPAEGAQTAMVSCEQCGMQVAKADAHVHDGKTLCSHCGH